MEHHLLHTLGYLQAVLQNYQIFLPALLTLFLGQLEETDKDRNTAVFQSRPIFMTPSPPFYPNFRLVIVNKLISPLSHPESRILVTGSWGR